jgi:hypothetical protein
LDYANLRGNQAKITGMTMAMVIWRKGKIEDKLTKE